MPLRPDARQVCVYIRHPRRGALRVPVKVDREPPRSRRYGTGPDGKTGDVTSLPGSVLSMSLSTDACSIWKIDVIGCASGDVLEVAFEAADRNWSHGLWLAVDGHLDVGGEGSSQVVLWERVAPPVIEVRVLSTTDGLLRLYNVWDSGRGIQPFESQSATSGMQKEVLPEGVRYRCQAISREPRFDSVVFTIHRSS